MKNTTLLVIIGVILLAAGFYAFKITSSSPQTAANVPAVQNAQDMQDVTISERDLNYYPRTIIVKAGQPVRLALDSSVTGCLRSFTIPSLGVAKYARTPKETIEFIPQKVGTYPFRCSMGMGTGTLVVQ